MLVGWVGLEQEGEMRYLEAEGWRTFFLFFSLWGMPSIERARDGFTPHHAPATIP